MDAYGNKKYYYSEGLQPIMKINGHKFLEERKIKEIEHSDRRRSVVKSFEYFSDLSPDQNTEVTITDPVAYEEHFSNMKFYSVNRSSFAYRDKLVFQNIEGAVALDYCCGNGEMGSKWQNEVPERSWGLISVK